MPDVAGLGADAVREALRLLGEREAPANARQAARALRETLVAPGMVRALIERAPPGARDMFVRLSQRGPAAVEDLLGRGWWGHGALPPPLDWLQRRALVTVGADGLVHVVDEARRGFLDLSLDLTTVPAPAAEALRIERVGCVVVASSPAALDRALTVAVAGLRGVAPTVAVSERSAGAVSAALRAAGVWLAEEPAVTAAPAAPALPSMAEDAVGPRALRALLARAVEEERQVRLRYFASSRGGAPTERVVDPWSFEDDLLLGYCHLRAGERTFAVDRIGHARLLPSAVEHRAG
ncbi:MAG: WYL domain-containing protein [Nitriliruptorales bacterium]|nr:WYL domain-containing protein [Nitriliruptorales bacterium]